LLRRRLLRLALVPLVLLLAGTAGYRLLEGPAWSWLDALYMATITLTTVGFAEVHPLSGAGRVFTIAFCLGGVFTIFYIAGEFFRVVVSGEIQNALGRRRMELKLAEMTNHFIVCGYGRMGRLVCKEFESRRLPYVVIDQDPALEAEFSAKYGVFVHGDATSDVVLHRVGAARAKALVTVASSDADNLYIVLSARLLNDKLYIVARAEETAAEEKLKRVGANRVISPYVIGGTRVAMAVLRPTVVDVIDLATRTDSADMQIEEIRLQTGCGLVGQTLSQRRFGDEGLVVVAIKSASGSLTASPTGETVLEADSTLVVIGNRVNLDKLAQMAETR
jgi:voltage-gated potassium channel